MLDPQTENQSKEQPKRGRADHLKRFQFKKGQSGNPKGRPKGKTLKEFAREYLQSLPDDEKLKYLSTLPTDIVWKMAEGNPMNQTDVTSGGKSLIPDVERRALLNEAFGEEVIELETENNDQNTNPAD